MTAITMKQEGRKFPAFLILLAVLCILVIATYGGYTRSRHADVTHADQKWNPVTIQTYYENNGCKPHIDICEEEDIEIHWCQVDEKNSIALVIGHKVQQIITGYMARTQYWSARCP